MSKRKVNSRRDTIARETGGGQDELLKAPMPHIVNFRDIARAAGVSASAVSLALRGNPKVSEATRLHILETAKQLGYKPNPLVSALMSSLRVGRRKEVSGILAVITALPVRDYAKTHPGFGLLVDGARRRAGEAGYAIDEFSVSRYQEEHKDMEAILRARNITGLLLVGLNETGMELQLDWSRYAVCVAGGLLSNHHFMSVRHDYFQNMLCGVENLRRLGYKRIGLALYESLCVTTEHRFEAAYMFLRDMHGSDAVVPLLRAQGRLTRQVFIDWVRKYRPDAVISSDHRVLAWLKAEKIKVPEDLVVAHTDLAPGWGPFAGMDQCHPYVGAAAVEQLIFQCDHNQRGPLKSPQTLLLPGQWRDGATAPAKR